MNPPPIGFIGKAGSGKTTAAEILVKHFDYTRHSIAEPLKEAARLIWGPEVGATRAKMQGLGLCVRAMDSDAWLNNLLLRTRATILPCVDDVRFPNEYWALKQDGFRLIRVIAPREQRVIRLKANGKLQDEAELNDKTETALPTEEYPADAQIVNEDIETMATQLNDIIFHWRGAPL